MVNLKGLGQSVKQKYPQYENFKPTVPQEGLLSKLGKGYNWLANTAVGKTVGDILQGLEYPIGGYLSSTYKKSQELAPKVQAGEVGKPQAILQALGAGFGGIIPGIQNRTTIFDYLEKVKELTPAQKMAVGLPTALAIPSIPIGKVAKATGLTKLLGRAGGATLEIPVPLGRYGTKLGEALIPRYGQPETYKTLAKGTQQAIAGGQEQAVKLARPLAKLPTETQELAAKVLKGEATPLDKNLETLTEPIRQELIKWGQEAVKEGLLDEATFQKNFGKYLPRMYRKYEEGKKFLGFEFKPLRIDISRFKKRMDIPEDVREAMGEVTQAGYPTAKGISQLAQAVTRSKFFRKISESSEWASDIAKEGFEKLPETNRLGQLSGKHVLAPIAHDIQEMIRAKDPIEKVLNKATSWWKFGKVVMNPATQVRNVLSNVVLAHTVGGLSPRRVDIYIDALGDLTKRTGDYSEAKELGLLGTTFYGNEIKQMLNGVESGKGIINFLTERAKGLGNLYQAEEEWFKLALFKYQKQLGKNPIEAAKIAQDALFDYSEVPNSVKALRESVVGFPFLTFSYKALPALGKAFMESPTRFAQYRRLGEAIESFSPKEETTTERKVLPDYMKQLSKQYLKLPIKDKYGRSQYFDLSYIYPWYSFGGIQPFRHPLVGAVSDIAKNKDGLGQEIYSEDTDTEAEKQAKIAKYVWNQISPPLFGYSFGKLEKAISGELDYRGRTKQEMLPTIFDVFLGLRTKAINVKEEQFWRQKEGQKKLEAIKSDARKILRRPSLSQEEREKAISNYKIKSQDILRQLIDMRSL